MCVCEQFSRSATKGGNYVSLKQDIYFISRFDIFPSIFPRRLLLSEQFGGFREYSGIFGETAQIFGDFQ